MPAAPEQFEREVDPQQQIRQFFSTVRRGWLTIVTSLGLGLLLGVAAFLYVPRQWTSTYKGLIKSNVVFDAIDQKALDDEQGPQRRSMLEDQLHASDLIEETLDKLEWPAWAHARGTLEGRQSYVERVRQHLHASVAPAELGGRMVTVSFTWGDRGDAARFCESLVNLWKDNSTSDYMEELTRRLADQQRLLQQKKLALDQRTKDVEQFEMRHGISAINQHQDQQARADDLRATLDALSPDITNDQVQLDQLDQALGAKGADGKPLLPPTLDGATPIMNDEKAALIQRMGVAYLEIQQLLSEHWTRSYPPVKALEDEIEQLVVQVSNLGDRVDVQVSAQANPKYESLKRERDDVNARLQGKLAARAMLESELKEVGDLLKTLPQVLREYWQLRMDVASAQQAVLDQQQAAGPYFDKKALADARGPKNLLPLRTLEKPQPAPKPTASVGWLALGICTMLGLATAVAIVIGRELLRTSFEHAEQARTALKLPVLGEVAPIQTVLEVRRNRFQRSIQVAASAVILVGLAAMIVVCVAYPDHLPTGVVRWALDLRDLLV
jgi:hypothetical protein